jgi:transcriptional regulator with XRE-family HTH domain
MTKESDERKEFGGRLRAIRMKREMTYLVMSSVLGVSVPTIMRYERGLAYPSIPTLKIMSRRLGISVDELLGITEGTSTPPGQPRAPQDT